MLRTWRALDLLGVTLVATMGFVVPAAAQSDGLLCAARDILGQYETMDIANGIALAGDYAYVAGTSTGLLVLDISDPTTPVLVSSVDLSGVAQRVALGGLHAFVAVGSLGVQVVDVTDPTAPAVVGGLDRDGSVMDVATDGVLLYMADGYGLVIVDVSDPANPLVVGELTVPGSVSRVCLVGSLAYVSGESAGVHLVDVSTPSSPVLLASFDPGTGVQVADVAAEAGLAYIGHNSGVTVLDVSDPAQPQAIGDTDGEHRVWADLALDNGRLYIDGGRLVLDVSDPTQPSLLGSCLSVANQAVIRNPLAFTASDEGVEIVNVSEPPKSGVLGSIPSNDGMEGVDISGSYAFVAELGNGMSVIDISDPAALVRVASVDTGGFTHDVVVQGDYAYVVDRELFIIDISDPTQPVIQNGPNNFRGSRLDVEGDIAVVSGSSLRFIDIRDPSEPVLLASHPGIGGREHGHVRVESGHVFTAGKWEFRIYDLSNPGNDPIVTIQGTGNNLDVDMNLGIACVETYNDGAFRAGIFDISDLSAPVLLGEIMLPDRGVESIEILGDKILLGLERGLLWLVDISNPAAPSLVVSSESWYIGATPWDIAVAEDRAYVIDRIHGLAVLDISDCPPCPADFNGNGVIDTRDFIAFLGAWASERGEDCSAGDCSADLTGDGIVDTRDFVEFLSFWAGGC